MAGKKARAKTSKPPKTDKAAFRKQFDAFELKPSPNKGIGAFATKAMPAGTSFHRETALMVFTKPQWLVSELDVAKAYRQLSDPDKTIFDTARHDTDHPQNCKCKMGVLAANQFSKNDFSPAMLYPIASRFNHSCSANTIMLCPKEGKPQNSHTFRTIKAVQVGEELNFSYTSRFHFSTHAERQQELVANIFNFVCLCSHCQSPLASRQISDMRRILLRHLHFRLRKRDIDDENTPPESILNTITDPKLVKNGVYSLLYAMLLESEGIISGPDSHMAYALTAWHVLNVAYHEHKLARIPPHVVRDMRLWMRKSEANIRLQYGDDLDEAGTMWLGVHELMNPICVPDDGYLEWEALDLIAEIYARKDGMRIFSSVPP